MAAVRFDSRGRGWRAAGLVSGGGPASALELETCRVDRDLACGEWRTMELPGQRTSMEDSGGRRRSQAKDVESPTSSEVESGGWHWADAASMRSCCAPIAAPC
jgi:hypothetical protein